MSILIPLTFIKYPDEDTIIFPIFQIRKPIYRATERLSQDLNLGNLAPEYEQELDSDWMWVI